MKIATKEFIRDYMNINDISTELREIVSIYSTIDMTDYLVAIKKFYNLLDYTYLKDGIMLYIYNDYILTFDFKFKEIKDIYDYAKENQLFHVCNYLADFLTSYHYSLESNTYKQSQNYDCIKKEFYKFFDRKEFYGDGMYLEHSYDYYKDFIACKNFEYDHNFFCDRLYKLYNKNNIHPRYNELFEYILNNDNLLLKIIEFDPNCKQNASIYNTNIIDGFKETNINGYHYDAIINLTLKMYYKDILDENSFITVCNNLIKSVNKITEMMNNEIKNTVLFISDVDQILNYLNQIKRCQRYYDIYKLTIEKCIKTLLYCKRRYLKSDSVNCGLEKFQYEFNPNSDEIERIKEDLSNNLQTIFLYLKVDFDQMLTIAIKTFSESPVPMLVQYVCLDSEQGTYMNWDNDFDSSFSKYYHEKGIQIVESLSDELDNVYHGNYYYLMLRHLSTTFTFSGSIIATTFKKFLDDNLEEYICKNFLEETDLVFQNDYVLCCYLIICIEQLICEQIENIQLKCNFQNMSANIENLFDYCKDNKLSRDIYMFVYYVLYERYGLNYRNNFMHGNFIHKKNLTVELLYLFSCLIGLFVVGDKDEKKN